ncbi:MAG: HK97 family phage prohead protease [Pseudomonadota bacterium]
MDSLLWASPAEDLEIRRAGGSTTLKGRFPYGKKAVLSDGGRRGRPRKEQFRRGAFKHSIESETQEIHVLVGHDFNRPIARKLDGSLKLRDTAAALEFETTIAPDLAEVSYVRDALTLLGAGLTAGVSPGFRLPPERAVPRRVAEEITEEPDDPENGMHRALIRTINEAILFELSIVTRPAYPETQVEARNWTPTVDPARPHPLQFWRP